MTRQETVDSKFGPDIVLCFRPDRVHQEGLPGGDVPKLRLCRRGRFWIAMLGRLRLAWALAFANCAALSD